MGVSPWSSRCQLTSLGQTHGSGTAYPMEHVTCPLCGADEPAFSATGHVTDYLYGRPGEFTLGPCGRCGHYYLNPRPTSERIWDFYSDDYIAHQHTDMPPPASATLAPEQAYNPGILRRFFAACQGFAACYYWLRRDTTRSFQRPPLVPTMALELGCGNGGFLLQLREQGWQAVGIEPCEKPARILRLRGCDVRIGTSKRAQFPARSFDAVFAWMVIEHLPDPLSTLGEIHRILKPTGTLIFSVPNYQCWETLVFWSLLVLVELPTHLQQFTPKTIRFMLKSSGFADPRIVHQRNVLNVVGSMGHWLQDAFPRLKLGRRIARIRRGSAMGATWQWLLSANCSRGDGREGGRLTVVARPVE